MNINYFMKILLDTNFLIYCAKQKINYLDEIEKISDFKYEIFSLSNVIEELKNLEKKLGNSKSGENASLALEILKQNIRKNKIKIINVYSKEKNADIAIKKLAKKESQVIVATMDKELKESLKKLNIKIIIIRQKKRLKII